EFAVSAAIRILEREGKISRGSRGEGPWTRLINAKAQQSHPHAPDAKALLARPVSGYPGGTPIRTELSVLARRANLPEEQTRHALTLLEKSGAISAKRPFAGRSIRVTQDVPFQALGLDMAAVREQERRALMLLRRMTDYAYARTCRR